MGEKLYPYAFARISSLCNELIKNEEFIRLIALSKEEIIKTLSNKGYPDINEENFELHLTQDDIDTCKLAESMTDKERLFKLFFLRGDYHNIKVILKEEFSKKSGEKFLTPKGSIPPKKMKEIIENRRLSALSPFMEKAIEETLEVYQKTEDVGLAFSLLDMRTYEEMLDFSKENAFAKGYMEREIDLYNISTSMRIYKLKGDIKAFSPLFCAGGSLEKGAFLKEIKKDSGDFAESEYKELFSLGISGNFALLSKRADDYLMDYIKKAALYPLRIEQLFAYVYAKEIQNKNLRLILKGKISGMDDMEIRERLRESYV